ncbi:GNAT family N-acetyltransferase [Bacillus carboniphilus]|uniref:GNAT family N-acetyltransferase n=1 Tax=Bacillus carboniphilus TaxID=86663 RepID=A0ABY9JUG4_9BACI|nr:GNAT family N-acetyltransferase [Bacillus carboniphilus]WLR43039.1 GNAT family N-acetyltransferase [Bacillus carboniphilus]
MIIFNIKEANQTDIEFIFNSPDNTLAEEPLLPTNIDKMIKLNQFILQNGGYYLIAKGNNQIYGWILLGENMDYYIEKETIGYIFDLYVLPPKRKTGIGTKLLKAGINSLKEKGYNEIRLNVFVNNPAKYLYKKMGFSERQTLMSLKI